MKRITYRSQLGFAHVGLVLLFVVVLGVAGGAGYYIWHKNHDQKQTSDSSQTNKNSSKVTNYDECLKSKDSKVQESYPPVCVTKDGQHFTQPSIQKYLTIKEWGVKMVLPSAINDATYHIVTTNKYLPPSAFISTAQLDGSAVCQKYYAAGATPDNTLLSYQWLERYALSDTVSFDEGQTKLAADQAAKQRPDIYKKVGDFVYHTNKGNGMPCSDQSGAQSDAFAQLFETLTTD